MAGKISELTAASSVADADEFELLQGGTNKRATAAMVRAGLAAASHTHTAANVSDFSEAVDDRVNALLVEGTGVTLTYDDVANTLTVDAAGGGGYEKLVASGTNGGTFTFYDDTATVGLTKVNIRAGAAHVYGAGILEILSSAGGSLTGGYGLASIYGGELHVSAHVYDDANGHDGFELNGNVGLALHGSKTVSWASGSHYNAKDFGIARADVNAGKATNGSTGYSQWRCQSLAVNNSAAGSTPGTCVKKVEVFDVAGASLGYVPVYDAIT